MNKNQVKLTENFMSPTTLSMTDNTDVRPSNCNILADLRRQIVAIERGGDVRKETVALGVSAIDLHLPGGGLTGSAVHEVCGELATWFSVLIASRTKGPVLWCLDSCRRDKVYGPGLEAMGFNLERLILAQCCGVKEMLWVTEQGLRSPAVGFVISELMKPVSLIESRRLQLAAEAGRTFGLILRLTGRGSRLVPSTTASRWRVEPAPNGIRRFILEHCRGSMVSGNEWEVRYDGAEGALALATEVSNGASAVKVRACSV